MITRIVLFKLTPAFATDEGRAETASLTRDALAALPMVQQVEVLGPADDATATSWDLAVRVDFDRVEDVATYRDHPDHRTLVDQTLAPRLAFVKAWNFGPLG